MTEDEYNGRLGALGFTPTNDETIISRVWVNMHGMEIMITKAEHLSPEDRATTIEWHEKSLGKDGWPRGARAH